ncbi:Alpha-ketoglutarate-dependent dioxygenase alkB-like protein 6 [Hypsibius exemplaris]|uniref:Alpha-ketoglutarate-dependent dioxygenase alkB-like protein 6 n=1 Tax=Hypsibius exemplaris TaxID=2072580 RepID=A0A1W0WWY3_HYPEX|nr:Alpha-ketoglutarate-dependent dioxygenase alkB-like protein 6 [Hypsibius exemplaris]
MESNAVFLTENVDLELYRVKSVPNTIYYIPDFLLADEEAYLLQKVQDAPKPKWTQLTNRRLQNWGGHPHVKGMIAEDLPSWLQVYASKIGKLGLFGDKVPNHVLVNEYVAGQGIMPHVDGPVFFPTITTLNLGSHTVLDFYTTLKDEVSPTAHATSFSDVIEVDQPIPDEQSQPSDRHAFSLLLRPRSLVIIKDDVYTGYLHGIREVRNDTIDGKIANLPQTGAALGEILARETRVSLTIRLAQKTSKFKFNVFRT